MNGKRTFYGSLMIAFLTASIFAQTAGLPRFKRGETYAAVRVKMLKAGWKPFRAKDADECAAGDARCKGRPEMQACSGTGVAACRFLWKRREKTVAIFTVGEENALYNGYELQ